ncbi:MAG: 16S rRNA (cytidine(1402)-2'-O)-methyltransferase, partial [Edaphobacter sp.]
MPTEHERDQNQPLAPGLYLVATPIGNLEDITLRALRVLRSVDRIACEDTRQTQKLLNHFEIRTPTVSYHMHNELARAEELVLDLKQGARIAVVSDAGTPGIADPGGQLAAAAIAAGVPVFPIPGANAAISALIASGLPTERFTFHGFLPAKEGQRKTALEELPRDGSTHLFYEAPHRIVGIIT